MKINKPKIKYTENIDINECLENNDFNNVHIVNKDNIVIENITMDSCIFDKVIFSKIENVSMMDIIFNDCDLSNVNFDNEYLTRIVFNNCKLSGTSFINSNLEDIVFNNCVMKYLNLSETIIDACEVKNISLDKDKLYKTEFRNTKLKDTDFTTCDTYGVIFDMKSVKGIIVNSLECRDLALMLDIIVRD